MIDSAYSEVKKPVNMRAFLAKYTRNWYWFALAIVVSLAGAYFYLRYTPPVYQVSSVLLIQKESKDPTDAEIIATQKGPASEKIIENEIEVIKSRNLIRRVVDELNLSVAYFQPGAVRKQEEVYTKSPIAVVIQDSLAPEAYTTPLQIQVLNRNQFELQEGEGSPAARYSFDQPVKRSFGTFRVRLTNPTGSLDTRPVAVTFSDPEEVAQSIQTSLKAELVNQKGTTLKLSMETTLPDRGKAILGRLMNDYALSLANDRSQEVNSALALIDERLRLITGELNSVEKNVESYKSGQGITDLSTEGNLVFEAAKANDAKMNDIQFQVQTLDGVEKYLKSNGSGVAPAVASINDPMLTGLLTKLGDLQGEQEKYNRTTQPGNPFRQTVEAQVQNTRKAIDEYVVNERQNLQVMQNNLKARSNQLTSSLRTIPRKEREFLTIKRQQAIKENLYLLLLQKREEATIAHASKSQDSRVMDKPYASPRPVKPSTSGVYLLALFAGLLIPAGFIEARSAASDKVKSKRDIETEAKVPVFAEIVRKPKGQRTNLVDLSTPSIIAEQFRMLRANLQYAAGPGQSSAGRVILVTSSVSGEGKSFISVNLALSLATLNKKVVVLELDLRKPQIAQYLGMDWTKSGLSDFLTGQPMADSLVRQSVVNPNLYVIPSGPIPANPTELLSNGRIDSLIASLRQEYDFIIMDTPPVSMLADASLLSEYADTTFYVVRHEYTPRNYMRLLSDLHDSQRFPSLNVIVNAVNYPNGEDFGYGYAYASSKAY
ncbi:polysaccharide biosynthesis tyrosine autokinase [Spirosoma rhododendri]|uniref:non-specific protein-tyrosine kinase n=2 Tax=Spirosoma rhododendri TaxID=2728024 RepID=A0A7L5DNS6_9BACT|nr:polysaccharide biosynthesis tyrosine autokinase [Spirosoma rhododendri]